MGILHPAGALVLGLLLNVLFNVLLMVWIERVLELFPEVVLVVVLPVSIEVVLGLSRSSGSRCHAGGGQHRYDGQGALGNGHKDMPIGSG